MPARGTVLTEGSAGVFVFVLQFARLLGTQVIETTLLVAKAERLNTLGVAAAINLNYVGGHRIGTRKWSS